MIHPSRHAFFIGTAALIVLLSSYLLHQSSFIHQPNMAQLKHIHLRFEVKGKVQGVFFRNCTKNAANKLGLVGWVQNTPRGTVIGEAQGDSQQIESMKQWLQYDSSKIPSGQRGHNIQVEEAEFEEQSIDKITFESFVVDRKKSKNKKKDFTLFKKK